MSLLSPPTSTPSRRSTKFSISDENPSRPSSNHNQATIKRAVRDELENQTWQFDATTVARMLSPKKRKSPLDPRKVDTLDDYEDIKIDMIDINDFNKVANSFKSTPELPRFNSEFECYSPLCVFLNDCLLACRQVSNLKGKGYYHGLKFIVWDHPMADGIAGAKPLKPDLAGRKGSSHYQLLIPVEIKDSWLDLVCQAGTYARCLNSASPLRQFALVLGYNHTKQEFRFLIFHRGGLTSSLPLDPNSETGQRDTLRIFLAILSWETPAHAGFPMWCNDSEMALPASATGDESIHAQVKKVLHQSLCIRGRAPQVTLMSMVNASQTELPPNALIPTAESMCSRALPRRSRHQQGLPEEEDASNQHASGSRSRGGSGKLKAIGPRSRGENGRSKAIAIPRCDSKNPIRYIKQHIFEPSLESVKIFNLASPGAVVKTSWVSMATRGIESDLLRDCSGLFGTPTHYYSFLAYHDENSLATNHLFLPPRIVDLKSYFWPVFEREHPSLPDYRGLWVYVSAYAGHSLVTADRPKVLIESVLHACLGWFNMMQKGYQHRDISIGNIVMLDEGVKTKAFEVINLDKDVTVDDITKKLEELNVVSSSLTWKNKLAATLRDLGITDKCHGFVIDGDMAIKIPEYFNQKHDGSRSGTYEFMSDELLEAAELGVGYLQSPVDDLFSHYFTMQWAAAFNDKEFATPEAVPLHLDRLRQDLSGSRAHRLLATHLISRPAKLKADRYGRFLLSCHPFLRSWYSSLLALNDEFQECLQNFKLEDRTYADLFSLFAVKGVAQLAELVHTHTQNMC